MPDSSPTVPRLTYLRIKNYRALRDVEFRDLTPLTVLIGPNGSGKSTVLDALDFLAEAVRGNLVEAWEKRDRFRGMRTRGSEGNIEFEVELLQSANSRHIIYLLKIAEYDGQVRIKEEKFYAKENNEIHPLYIVELNAIDSTRKVTLFRSSPVYKQLSGKEPDDSEMTFFVETEESLFRLFNSLNFQGPLKEEFVSPFVSAVSSYRLFRLTDDHLKGYSDAGPRERLSPNGDNLPNVLYYLHERHPETLANITAQLRRWVPQLADIVTEITSDERLLLRFKDGPFEKPFAAKYMSDGTMRLAAILTLLYEPNATGLLGMEEPDNELHPLLLYRLAEELGKASETRQLLVTTHSPMLLDALDPAQVWLLHRGADGYTLATRTADIPNVPELVEDGAPLGYLWTSNAFTVGNPLAPFHPRPDAR